MAVIATDNNLAHPFWPVKSNETSPLYGTPHSMIHHNVSVSQKGNIIVYYSKDEGKRYGVSSSRRLLPPQLLLKKYDRVRDCLRGLIGLAPRQLEAVMRLLRFWAYYGQVYAKAGQIAEEPGCSRATFWRAVGILKGLGIVEVRNRYVLRPHAQISNLYLLDYLVILIAQYLSKHLAQVWPPYFIPYVNMAWAEFERLINKEQLKLPT